KDEFQWLGTRDPAAFLAVPAAIAFLRESLSAFRERGHKLAREFRERMSALTGLGPPVADAEDSYGTMATAALPAIDGEPPTGGKRDPLQDVLWERFRIEVPVVHWNGRRMLRTSWHLYNDRADLNRLMEALESLLAGGGI
ncbi:MAG: aminotransferase, partial [Planctomycetaceae bacterium]